ncbi:MAG: tetraacyldisaccharide 4'-kinase [Planctomycetaceae bacterium]|nr:tetraacyldisaccharide 4'-kinase [Planctomycetaceae bacterium]
MSASLVRAALLGASPFYRLVVQARNALFDSGLRTVHKVGVPVVSIGNVTTGGTGKTPMVACVVDLLKKFGFRPGIISRGYRADSQGTNDELKVLEQNCPGIPHVQNSDRVAAAQTLLQQSDADMLVMDDGFQHRRMHRDVDIVLIDATCPFGYGYGLPRGLLREPLASLHRATAVVLTRVDQVPEHAITEISDVVLQYAPHLKERLFHVAFAPSVLISADGESTELSSIRGKPVFLMSGIGNPAAFETTVRSFDATVVGRQWFPDHHHYSISDLVDVERAADAAGAEWILTTQKDLVKLPASANRFQAVCIKAQFSAGELSRFEAVLNRLLR